MGVTKDDVTFTTCVALCLRSDSLESTTFGRNVEDWKEELVAVAQPPSKSSEQDVLFQSGRSV